MSLYKKYELFGVLRDDGVKTFEAKDLATGRAVHVHLLMGQPGKLAPPYELLDQIRQLGSEKSGDILETGEHTGTPFVVTVPLDAGLREWLDSLLGKPKSPKTGGDLSRVGRWKIPTMPPQAPAAPAAPTPGPPELPAAERTLNFSVLGDAPLDKTRLFAPGQQPAPAPPVQPAAAPPLPPPPVPATAPAPAAEEPGEFTRIFGVPGSPPRVPPAAPAQPPPLPQPLPAAEPAPTPGEFTRMFGRGGFPGGTPPAATPPTPSAPGADAPGEFTQFFSGGLRPTPPPAPAAPVLPANPEPTLRMPAVSRPPEPAAPPPSASTPGELTRLFDTPSSPAGPAQTLPAPPANLKPGEFTKEFQTMNSAPSAESELDRLFSTPSPGSPAIPQFSPPSPAPQAPVGGQGSPFGATVQFNKPAVPAPPAQASAGPSEFTRMMSMPAELPTPQTPAVPAIPQAPAAPAAVPLAAGPGKKPMWPLIVFGGIFLLLVAGLIWTLARK